MASSDFWKNVFTFCLHVSSHAVKPLSSSTRNNDVTTKSLELKTGFECHTTRVYETAELTFSKSLLMVFPLGVNLLDN